VPPPAIGKGPSIIALILLGTNCVTPKNIASVLLMSVYIVGLASWCIAPKYSADSSSAVHHHRHRRFHHPIANMPSLPDKGHVPTLITNPLGSSLTNSKVYRAWLRAGAVLGLLLPLMVLMQLTLRSRHPSLFINTMDQNIGVSYNNNNIGELKRIVGGPTFLLCWQALSEAAARAALLPLPIRILIPVSYSTLRLSSLQYWAFPAADVFVPTSVRALGMANFFYWYANLALFLIPVGVMRYLRAHFYCVEAVEVTVRHGGESSVGLFP
jgi:hypothetical protein